MAKRTLKCTEELTITDVTAINADAESVSLKVLNAGEFNYVGAKIKKVGMAPKGHFKVTLMPKS